MMLVWRVYQTFGVPLSVDITKHFYFMGEMLLTVPLTNEHVPTRFIDAWIPFFNSRKRPQDCRVHSRRKLLPVLILTLVRLGVRLVLILVLVSNRGVGTVFFFDWICVIFKSLSFDPVPKENISVRTFLKLFALFAVLVGPRKVLIDGQLVIVLLFITI